MSLPGRPDLARGQPERGQVQSALTTVGPDATVLQSVAPSAERSPTAFLPVAPSMELLGEAVLASNSPGPRGLGR